MTIRKSLLIATLLTILIIPSWAVFSLELDTGSVDFGQNLHPNNSPFYKEPAVTATVKNSGEVGSWSLKANATGDITSNAKSTTIPVSQLELKGGDLDTFTSFVATPSIQVETGGVGTVNVPMDYKLNIYWNNVAADDYSVTIWYTLTGE